MTEKVYHRADICAVVDIFVPSPASPKIGYHPIRPVTKISTKRNLLTTLILLLATSPLVQADSNYAGITYGLINVDDQDSSFEVETGNLGIVVGGVAISGLGFELFYNFAVREDEISVNGTEVAAARITTFGVLGVYQSPGQVYFKGKAGFAAADLDFDIDGASGSFDDDAAGIAYGVAVGAQIGPGALEPTYLVLPEFKDFEGLEFDADVDLINQGYNWNFQACCFPANGIPAPRYKYFKLADRQRHQLRVRPGAAVVQVATGLQFGDRIYVAA